jgi:hypothetical protein
MTVPSISGATRSRAMDSVHTPSATPEAAPPIDLGRDHVDTAGPPLRSEEVSRVAARTEPGAGRPAVVAGAHAYATGGLEGFDRWVDAHPSEARQLLCIERERLGFELEAALGAEYRGHLALVHAMRDSGVVVHHLAERAAPMLREAVRGEASARVEERLHWLETTSPERLATQLRAAPEGSMGARLARELHLDGGAMDAERCEAFQRRSLEGLRGLRDRLQGQTWGPDEVPGSTARVRDRVGDVAPGSIAAAAFARPANTAREIYGRVSGAADDHDLAEPIVAETVTAAELVVAEGLSGGAMLARIGEGLFAGLSGAAIPFLVMQITNPVVDEIHAEIDEARAARRALSQDLGI